MPPKLAKKNQLQYNTLSRKDKVQYLKLRAAMMEKYKMEIIEDEEVFLNCGFLEALVKPSD